MMKKILITSGGTQEYIDDVRVLTNISSGKLGALIADELQDVLGFEVFYLCGKNSVIPSKIKTTNVKVVRTTQEAIDEMKLIIIGEKIDVVIHSMAVSDFSFKRDVPVKCKSNNIEGFVDYIRETIVLNPKIISMIKQWRPEVFLVGFKFEVGVSEEELKRLAIESIEKNNCDLVMANDKKEIQDCKVHVGHFAYFENFRTNFKYNTVLGKEAIAKFLRKFLEERMR